ncbi:serine/threonine protein phosphatase [Mesobaculum littorinae]|uniref:Serine/threonine protein phosphatase n=1 Tax=Mesobaculum littorinae TaxID=2486419 RepID=A0A438AI98_9RHOB|nr:metallophosphoesterase [Mesobaculum littorinae]RVV98374.1 serine/threonine protein phosphatase [Mesobaculum littorinae]
MTIYAVPDIHGYSDELDRALRLIGEDGGRDARIVFLGDYTDRGPDSRGVLDRLIAGRSEGRDWICLMGNHDRMFLRFATEGQENDRNIRSRLSWLNARLGGTQTLGSYGLAATGTPAFLHPANGGWETLASYGLGTGEQLTGQELIARARTAIPEPHLQFLSDLPLWHEEPGLLFVHAGLRPGVPLDEQDEDDLIWIRDGFLDDDTDHGRLVVHGHTALDAPTHFGNRIDLDAGAGYGNPLIPAAFDGTDCFLLTETGRVPLPPPG